MLQIRIERTRKMDKIKNILKEIRPEFDFETSENFIEDGFLDSFDIVTLIAMIEETYKVSIDGLDIVPENFYSFDSIKDLIQKSGGSIENNI
ncbi:acyl carrier protein [Hominibacterium faecale]|uniref:acyl carrier protein n=1 Tax=Hominibacterium faecale TaxID=2839743 RepID=UPI0022B2A76E|nr:acyl carrier protein [Hominibacterium faecale]